MSQTVNDPDILLVPLLDVNWLVFAPFDPARDYRIIATNLAGSTSLLSKWLEDV